MKKYYLLFALSSLVIAGCGTMHAAGGANTEQEQIARSYRDNGDVEASIETYKKLIEANPHHFNSVLYQHEIMRTTEGLSDPLLLVDEIKHTLQMFKTACDENYEGANPEAIQLEHDALGKYISSKGKQFNALYQKLKNNIYYSVAMEIYKVFIENFGDSKDYCEILYYLSDMQYFNEDYHAAATGYTKVLDECNSETRWEDKGDYQSVYKDAAHGAVLAYDKIVKSDACPKMPEKTDEMYEKQAYPEYPIAECEMNFINAAIRYEEILKNNRSPWSEFSTNRLYMTAKIYFDHNQFDKAISLFREVVQNPPESEITPASDVTIYAANYILEIYRLTKQYEKMFTTIQEFKDNSRLMSYVSSLAKEFFDLMNDYENALLEKFKEDKSTSEK